jgi:hypothetical protein
VNTEIMASDPLCTIVWEQSELAHKVTFRGTCTLNRVTREDFGIRVCTHDRQICRGWCTRCFVRNKWMLHDTPNLGHKPGLVVTQTMDGGERTVVGLAGAMAAGPVVGSSGQCL